MKNLFIIFIITFMLFSCDSKYERLNDSIEGVWEQTSMQYQDSLGIIRVINNSGYKLVFTNDHETGHDTGYQIKSDDTINFTYYIEFDCCNFSFELEEIKKMPVAAIGKVTLYDYYKIDKKTIEFFTDSESDYLNQQAIYKTSYLYTKVSDLAE